MSHHKPNLSMMCGKIAAGKSTLATRLSLEPKTVLISEDDWLGGLFADQLTTGQDYVRCSAKLRAVMGPHIVQILNAGLSVVLDFPANTVETRGWLHDVLNDAQADHTLYVFDVPDEICLERLRARNKTGDHAFAATEDQFRRFSKHYVPPLPHEGFTVKRVGAISELE